MTLPYSLYQILMFFFVYAFLGWCTEVIYAAVTTGKIVNRGFLNGPVCPIYGIGMVSILLLLHPLMGTGLPLFLGGTAITTLIELVGGWILYKIYHARWWDYSDKPFNLGGYICLQFSLAWGLGTLMVLDFLQPLVLHLVDGVSGPVGWVLVGVFSVTIGADLAASIAVAHGLRNDLLEMERVSKELHRVSDALTRKLGGTALTMDEMLDEKKLQLALAKADALESASALRDSTLAKADAWKQDKQESAAAWKQGKQESVATLKADVLDRAAAMRARLSKARHTHGKTALFGRARLLAAFPDMLSDSYAESLATLRRHMDKTGRME